MDYQNNGYELGLDAEIENDGQEFVVAEPGDYNFVVTGFERARHGGSEKIPPCNKAILSIQLDGPGINGSCIVKHNLYLHSKSEWRLCEFFTAIGQRKKGQKVSMNWNAVIGARGRCKVSKRSFRNKENTKDLWTNDIDKFYEPEGSDLPFTMGQNQSGYAAPQGNPAAPQGYPASGAAPSWQGGKF